MLHFTDMSSRLHTTEARLHTTVGELQMVTARLNTVEVAAYVDYARELLAADGGEDSWRQLSAAAADAPRRMTDLVYAPARRWFGVDQDGWELVSGEFYSERNANVHCVSISTAEVLQSLPRLPTYYKSNDAQEQFTSVVGIAGAHREVAAYAMRAKNLVGAGLASRYRDLPEWDSRFTKWENIEYLGERHPQVAADTLEMVRQQFHLNAAQWRVVADFKPPGIYRCRMLTTFEAAAVAKTRVDALPAHLFGQNERSTLKAMIDAVSAAEAATPLRWHSERH